MANEARVGIVRQLGSAQEKLQFSHEDALDFCLSEIALHGVDLIGQVLIAGEPRQISDRDDPESLPEIRKNFSNMALF